MKQQLGFTIIEILIAVAIVSILAMLAVPAYMDYTARTKVAEGLVLATPIKLAVTETHQSTGTFPTTNAQAAVPDNLSSNLVESIKIATGGVITVTYFNTKLGYNSAANYTVVFTPDKIPEGAVRWDCTGGTMPTKLRPKMCR